jgi:hypothetical protein
MGKAKRDSEARNMHEICKIFTTLNNKVQTKTYRFYLPKVLEELIKINSRCLAMNPKDRIPIDEAFYRMQDLVFSLCGMKDKEENPITQTNKIAGRSEWKLLTEHV